MGHISQQRRCYQNRTNLHASFLHRNHTHFLLGVTTIIRLVSRIRLRYQQSDLAPFPGISFPGFVTQANQTVQLAGSEKYEEVITCPILEEFSLR